MFAGELGESTTAPKPCCTGPSNGAGGSAVVGLDPNAGLIAATAPNSPLDATGAYVNAYPLTIRFTPL